MDFFTRISPAYKRAGSRLSAFAHRATQSHSSGLLGWLLGRRAPAYKTVDGQSGSALAPSSGLFSMFTVTPSYKSVAPVSAEQAPLSDAELAQVCADAELAQAEAELAGSELDSDAGACAPGPDQIVVL